MTPEALIDALTQPWAHGAHVDAAGAHFREPVVLDGLTLCSFDLSGAVFERGLSARGTRFRGMAWLFDARIEGGLDATGATFRTDLRLDGLRARTVMLDGAVCEGVAALDRAHLRRLSARDALFLANLSLADASVSEATDLAGATVMGGIWAEAATLARPDLTATEIDGRRHGV